MLLDGKPDGTESEDKEHYLLSDVLPEDKELRSNLHQNRLEKLLKHHQFEREDKHFERECLFCRQSTNDTRSVYLNHLYEKHNFHIAKPENLIFIDELVNMISSKLDKLQCIFCEKYFKDRVILKEHMRKKGHKRINPENKEYDKYFLVNYLGEKDQKEFKSKFNQKKYCKKSSQPDSYRTDRDSNVDSDPDWSDWTEENGPEITCLFCEETEMEYDQILDHMEGQHEFSFTHLTKGLNFYQKVKIVNFIRRQVHLNECLLCDTKFVESKNLLKHMKEAKHLVLEKSKWDQPEHYFPTYEDDLFLCFIQDDDESWWSSDEREASSSNEVCEVSKEMALAVLSDS